MLKGIPQHLSADILHALMLMGHGDDLVICDVNHPAATIAAATTYGRLRGRSERPPGPPAVPQAAQLWPLSGQAQGPDGAIREFRLCDFGRTEHPDTYYSAAVVTNRQRALRRKGDTTGRRLSRGAESPWLPAGKVDRNASIGKPAMAKTARKLAGMARSPFIAPSRRAL
ncbi:MAG: hypothetical protein INF93_04620 [Rhodobacter sp.]|nr:hypothetical protein [Rhodobacter sp.]